METVSGIVVAGGRSQRLGHDKRQLRLWGKQGPTLLEHTLAMLAPLCSELLVVLNDAAAWPQLNARLIPDVYADAGVLGGIYAGLAAARNPYALVVAADMPLLNADLLRAMLSYPRDYDALVPRALQPGKARNALDVEPLHAIYRCACHRQLQAVLAQGQRRITDFLELLRVTVLEAAELRRYDPQGYSFLNINTPADLEHVQRLIASP